MNPMTFLLVLTIFWIISIFIALPIGIKMPNEPEIGHADSAPSYHRFGIKILVTFLISLVATSIYWYMIIHFPTLFDFIK